MGATPPTPVSAFAVPSTSTASSSSPSWEDLNKSKNAAEHRFSRSWSWWTAQPRFASGSRYKENNEHAGAGDVAKRGQPEGSLARRTRDPARFSIKALSELDARPASKPGTRREQLEFLQRERDPDGFARFSAALVAPDREGRASRSVALEPLYADGRYRGVEQQAIDKGKAVFGGSGRTYPDWVARSRQGDGSYKTIAFDLKVPLYKPGTFMQTFYEPQGATGIKQEFTKRRERMEPGTEQRLVFDLVSGAHDYKRSRQAIIDFAGTHRDRSGNFVADSAQFLYRREIKDKSGATPRGTGRYEVKMSKPIALNPSPTMAASGPSSSSTAAPALPGLGGAASSTRQLSSSSAGSTTFAPLALSAAPTHALGPPAVRTSFGVSPRPPGSSSSSSATSSSNATSGPRLSLAPAPHPPPSPSSSTGTSGARQGTSSSASSSSLRSSTAASTNKGGGHQGPL
ncbi:hypothetical protein [Dyella sp. 2RAB6]|uniref:hypothetical protein n=1 Tax=Dyella sp. 2RAB6 TaxID=3232992 RepID=UPI003F8E8C96